MQGLSQSKGLSQSGSRSGARKVQSTAEVAAGSAPMLPVAAVTSIFASCPCCDHEPVEPVFLDGTFVCRGCSATCTLCGRNALPGDDSCSDCLRMVAVA